jgi:peptidyl-prolyl cis-trans isomerase SurA
VIAVLAISAGLLGFVVPAWAQAEQSIVVLVNDNPITVYDIEQRQRFLAVTTQEQPSPTLKKKATDMLIEEQLQIQQGRKLGITPDEQAVTTVLEGMAKNNNMSPDQLAAALGQMGVNIKTLRDRIRAQGRGRMSCGRNSDAMCRSQSPKSTRPSEVLATPGTEETTLQLRQVKYEIPTDADQATIAKQLAAVESVRAKVQSCSDLSSLTKDMKGFKIKTLQDQLPGSLGQPMRTLVMNAKLGQMTPPTLSGSAIEAYAVCGKHAIKSDLEKRQQTERKLLEEELGIRSRGPVARHAPGCLHRISPAELSDAGVGSA